MNTIYRKHKTVAPWSRAQVTALNRWQTCSGVHPFTCPDAGDVSLIATMRGWVCPHCSYTQDWAHEYMLGGGNVD